MTSFFTPECPLGIEVQKFLLHATDGMTVPELRRALRQQGKFIEEHNLRELLNHPHVFIALSGDRYCLRGQASPTRLDVAATEHESSPFSGDGPLIVNLPLALQDFVTLDVETTGLDPKQDRIIQLVAVRFLRGKPVACCQYYLDPSSVTIPYPVQRKLGFERFPQVADAVRNGRRIDEVAGEVRAFLADSPIVAHNARFDLGFLTAALGSLANPIVDTLELAVLLRPDLSRHRLEELVEAFGVDFDEARRIWLDAGGTGDLSSFDRDALHNAVTDVCLLAALYQRLVATWFAPDRVLREVHAALLPEVFGGSWEGAAPAVRPQFHRHRRMPTPPGEQPEQFLEHADASRVGEYLDRYRQAKGYAERPGQVAMATLTWDALAASSFKLIEAPTGTGKTLAYLIPAVLWAASHGEAVVLSTAYRNLQDQLLAEIAQVREITGLPFRHQVLKGAANYLCLDRLARYVEELGSGATVEERFAVAYLVAWALASQEGTLDVSHWCRHRFPILAHVLAAISSAEHGCRSPRCRELYCPLVRVTDDAKTAHLLIVNHALLLAEPKRLPPYRRLVVDEAHALEDVATQSLTEEVSQEALEALFNQLHDEQTRQGAIPRLMAQSRDSTVALLCRRVFGALDRLRVLVPDFGRHLAAFIRACEGKIDPRYGAAFRLEGDPSRVEATRWSRVEQARKQLFDVHLAELIAALSGLIEVTQALPMLPFKDVTLEDLQRALEALLEQQQLQQRIVRVSNRKHVYWLEVEPANPPANNQDGVVTEGSPAGRWAMKCAPIRVDDALARHYAELDTAVFVSATLSIRGGDFSFFVDRLGLGPFLGSGNIHAVESDLDYGNGALLGLVNYLEYTPVERTMKSFCEEFAKELQLLLDFTDGRALVLFTARDRAALAYQRCMDALASKGIPLYCQLPGLSRRQLQEDFAEQVESVLFGLQSFWEGVDVPGESLSFVVMEKLPFPFLFDPVFKARREDVVQYGQHEFNDFVFPLMAIRFKQGFGRLIRRKSDRGAVLLMDKRIHRKEYKYELLASLPGYLPRDEQAERSRRLFYQSLIERMPGLIHAGAKADLLASLPEDLPPDLIERLRAFALPERIAAEDYPAWQPTLLAALQDVFRFSGFRSAEQEEVVQQMLAGRDVLALLPTGSGKSLCFQLTALLRDGVTLVFSPLIALMRDQVQALQGRGIEIVAAIYSGQPADEREETFARMRSGKVRLVYISPERLRDPHLLETLRSTRIIQVVVDEAHCVAMWGPSFRPDFLYLPRLFEHIGSRPPLAAFTATATPEIRSVIRDALAMQDTVQVVASFDRPELKFVVCNAHSRYNSIRTKNDRFKVLLKLIQAADRTRESVLVYVATTVEAELLARRLRSAGYDARPYHGKMSAADRDSVQELFMDDHINIVVCTKAFGMGIDKSDIRYVIHMHMPGDLESYFQEAGRAGRDGQESYCILLYHRSDRDVHDFFIEAGMPDEELLNALIEQLRARVGETLYLDTVRLGESLGMDEVQLKVSLHLLEQAGFIERGADFTLRGSLTLRETPDAIEHHLAETNPLSASLFQSIVATLGWEPFRRLELDLLEAADRLGIPPGALDELLIRLAVADLAIYRPWEKGSIVAKGRQLTAGKAFSEEIASVAHLGRLHGKLDRMVGYAETTTGQGCRRALILRYFGERWDHGNCGGCDHCTPEAEYPWSQLTARDTANLYDYFDPAFTILEVVKWNQDQLRDGRNPFSTATLINVLKGNDFQRSGGNRSRMRALRACPQWGVFDALPRRDQVIERCLDRLEREAYVTKRTAEFAGADGVVTYSYPDLLERGREQLLQGELLQWALD